MPTEPRFAVILLTAPPPAADTAGENKGPFTKVDGRECLLRAAELFVNRSEIVQILTTFPAAEAEEARRRFGNHLAFSGVKIGEPADGWYTQLKALAERLEEGVTHILVHDAARPAVAIPDLDGLLAVANEHPEAPAALSATLEQGLVEVDGEGRPIGYRPADAFVLLLWPRLYPKALVTPLSEGEEPSADRLRLVPGMALNVRCNGPADARRVAAMIKLLPEPKREGPLSPFDEARW